MVTEQKNIEIITKSEVDDVAATRRPHPPGSLAAIAPHRWRPGQSGRPAGAAAYLGECLVAYSHSLPERLRGIVSDDRSSAGQVAAALAWLRAADSKNPKIAHAALIDLADRLGGKATSRVEVSAVIDVNVTTYRDKLTAALADLPPDIVDVIITRLSNLATETQD